MSPLKLTRSMSDDEVRRLYDAARATLGAWIDALTAEARETFPEKVTAFRPGMAAHGRYGKPCPVCGAAIQRVIYQARNEMDYCPACQTGGRLLADRSLSRLLKDDWPRTLEELEQRRRR
jgi:formamidopyrimidine-DNA glycosylase